MTTQYLVKDRQTNEEEKVYSVLADAQAAAEALIDSWITDHNTGSTTYTKQISGDNRAYVAVGSRTISSNFGDTGITLSNTYENVGKCYCVVDIVHEA